MVRALLIHNPAAGIIGHRRGLTRAVRLLEEHDWDITWCSTEKPSDIGDWARSAVEDNYDVVIAAGGDGTIGQTADGLSGSDVALGILPLGSGNVLARELGLSRPGTLNPFPLETAAQMLLDSERRRVDLGLANGRHFFAWAGMGFDAEVTRAFESQKEVKRTLGAVGFIVFAFMTLRTYAGMRTTVYVDGHRFRQRLILAVASNIELYGRWFHIAPRARLDDGLLDLCSFIGRGSTTIFYHLFSVLLRRHTADPRVRYHQARRVEFYTSSPMPVQVDGDPFGMTPLMVTVVPQSLTLLLPPKLARDRFVRS